MWNGRYSYQYYWLHQDRTKCHCAKYINVNYLDSAARAELVKPLKNSDLIKQMARPYVEEQETRLQPKRQRLALAVSEHADAERMSN